MAIQSLGGKARSFLDRTGIAGEILIADNGSSDGTLEIAGQLAAEHDWVHVLSVPSDGVDRGAPGRLGIDSRRHAPAALINRPRVAPPKDGVRDHV